MSNDKLIEVYEINNWLIEYAIKQLAKERIEGIEIDYSTINGDLFIPIGINYNDNWSWDNNSLCWVGEIHYSKELNKYDYVQVNYDGSNKKIMLNE